MNRRENNLLTAKGVTTLEERRFLAGALTAPVDLQDDAELNITETEDATDRSRPTSTPRTRDPRGTIKPSTKRRGEATSTTPVRSEQTENEIELPTQRSSGVRPEGTQVYSQDFNDIADGQPELEDYREVVGAVGDNVKSIKGFGADSQIAVDPEERAEQEQREANGQKNEANDDVRISFEEGALRALYTAGGNTSSHSGVQYEDEIVRNDPSAKPIEEAVISYRVKFEDDFPWQGGGKLPGVIANDAFRSEETKHSVRLMWREEGKLEFYIHTPDKRDRLRWNNGNDDLGHAAVAKGEWQDIEFRVKLNSFKNGKPVADGQLEGWINGKHAGYYDNVILRDSPADNINTMFFSTFYGGSSGTGIPQWWPTTDSSALFDDLSVERIDAGNG